VASCSGPSKPPWGVSCFYSVSQGEFYDRALKSPIASLQILTFSPFMITFPSHSELYRVSHETYVKHRMVISCLVLSEKCCVSMGQNLKRCIVIWQIYYHYPSDIATPPPPHSFRALARVVRSYRRPTDWVIRYWVTFNSRLLPAGQATTSFGRRSSPCQIKQLGLTRWHSTPFRSTNHTVLE
jgi:hypothetical protein